MADREKAGQSFVAKVPADLAVAFPKIGEPDSARAFIGQALAADSSSSGVQYARHSPTGS